LPDRRVKRFPNFWHDLEARTVAVAAHRQMTLEQALGLMRRVTAPENVPSRTALGRFWQTLDKVRRG
ncbi:MAG: hypothetical protein DI568_18210, partial [Sphingomonas sp.]